MRRQVYLNETEYVQLYASEGSAGTNSNNCAEGCGGCNSSGGVGIGGVGGSIAIAVAGSVAGSLIVDIIDPD